MTRLEVIRACFESRSQEEKEKIANALAEIQVRTENVLTRDEIKQLAFFAEPNTSDRKVVWSPNQISLLEGTPSVVTLKKRIRLGDIDSEIIAGGGVEARWLTAKGVAEVFDKYTKRRKS